MEKFVYENGNLFSIRAQETFSMASTPAREVDYLIIGDSTALYSIMPKVLSENSQSKALLAASLYQSEKVLNDESLNKVKKGIIIAQSFIDDHYEADLWNILVPNKLITLNQIEELKGNQSFYNYFLLKFKYYSSKMHLNQFAYDALLKRLEMIGWNFKEYRSYFRDNLIRNAGMFAAKPLHLPDYEFAMPYYMHFSRAVKPPTREIDSLKIIIKEAQKLNLKVYYVKTPKAPIPSHQNVEFYNYSIDKILSEIAAHNFKVIDGTVFSHQMKKEDFIDYSHPNKHGAYKFSVFVRSQL